MTKLNPQSAKDNWRHVRRVVIKLGTNIITGTTTEFCEAQVAPLISSIARLKRDGRQIVLVSSGAVGLGAGKLALDRARLQDVVMRQACAAVGQSLLMNTYEQIFRRHKIKIAQVLLTETDFSDRNRYLNLLHTMEKLLKLGVVPIVNENDTVSTAELEDVNDKRTFSDNDRLAALVMSKLEADALIMLTNVDGLIKRAGPGLESSRSDKGGHVIPLITEITPALRDLTYGMSSMGRGGMITKLEAAEIAMRTGGLAVIANGTQPDILERLFAGESVGTAFVPSKRLRGKRRWIAFAAGVRGRLIINAGARDAIISGKASLLAAGIVRVEDEFDATDVISIIDSNGREFARGIANCTSREAQEFIRLKKTNSVERNSAKALVLVTRDNIVLLEE